MSEVAKLMRYVSKPENELLTVLMRSYSKRLWRRIDVIFTDRNSLQLKCGLTLKERL
jgi:hypothetical protein